MSTVDRSYAAWGAFASVRIAYSLAGSLLARSLATTPASRIVRLCAEAGVKLGVVFQERLRPPAVALRDLGPGLGDVALRCCCFLEGLEVAEKRMGWAARSGKIVLRIALMRLRRHYEETYGKSGPLIG